MKGNQTTTMFKTSLKGWRAIRGLTQKELAEQSGLSEGSIGRYERDVNFLKSASYSTLEILADALDVELEQIFLEDITDKQESKTVTEN